MHDKSIAGSPLVSFIVPVRNLENLIERCIRSIQEQSYTDFEIIAVENGSTDASWNKLLNLSSTDKRIRPFRLTDCTGVAAARNFGLRKSIGKFICFVDGDDFLYPDFISRMIKPLVEGQADYTICDMTYDGNKRGTRTFPKNRIDFSIESEYKLGLRLSAGSSCGKLFRRNLIGSTEFPNLPIGEDSLFMLEIYTKKPVLVHVPYIGYYYYQNPESSMHDLTIDKIDSSFTFLYQGKSLLQAKKQWNIAGAYWKSRAKMNSIERFQQLKRRELKAYWKTQFISFLKSDFFDDDMLKPLIIAIIRISPVILLKWIFTLLFTMLNVARFFVNQKNSILRKSN